MVDAWWIRGSKLIFMNHLFALQFRTLVRLEIKEWLHLIRLGLGRIFRLCVSTPTAGSGIWMATQTTNAHRMLHSVSFEVWKYIKTSTYGLPNYSKRKLLLVLPSFLTKGCEFETNSIHIQAWSPPDILPPRRASCQLQADYLPLSTLPDRSNFNAQDLHILYRPYERI